MASTRIDRARPRPGATCHERRGQPEAVVGRQADRTRHRIATLRPCERLYVRAACIVVTEEAMRYLTLLSCALALAVGAMPAIAQPYGPDHGAGGRGHTEEHWARDAAVEA